MKNKTGRKNNTKQTTTWPSSQIFTMTDLFSLNPHIKPITMRTKIKKEITNGKLVDIGVSHNGKGRPKNVFCFGPADETVIDFAKKSGVILHSAYSSTKIADINAISFPTESEDSTESVETPATVSV